MCGYNKEDWTELAVMAEVFQDSIFGCNRFDLCKSEYKKCKY